MTELAGRDLAPTASPVLGGISDSTGGSNGLDLLSCGRPVAALVDQVDAGVLEPADEHQTGCAACQGALYDATTSARALDLLRVERPAVPAALVDRVLRQVRATRPAHVPLDVSGVGFAQLPGRVRVHRHVLAQLARAAASGAAGAGVLVAGSSATPTGTGTGGVRVALGLLVDGRTPLPVLAVAVRRAVRTILQHATDLGDIQVELTALDLLPGAQLDDGGPAPMSGPAG